MQSMTGFGRGVATGDCGTLTVEISAVNSRRQVDLRCSIPKELSSWEQQIRQAVQQVFSRGSLYLAISYQLKPEFMAQASHIDAEVFTAVAKELTALAKSSGIVHHPLVGDVLQVPGVLANSQKDAQEALQALLEPALNTAIGAIRAYRLEEGVHLKADLMARGETIRALLANIEGRGKEALIQLQERLRARLAELGAVMAADDERLAKELVFFAEKADITEEVVRLKTHLTKYFQLMEERFPGRELEFLGQEMNREITTLSSKTADLCISQDALALKVELSKIREQIMNIE